MTFLLNLLLAYLLVAAVLFIIYLITAFAFWEKTKKIFVQTRESSSSRLQCSLYSGSCF